MLQEVREVGGEHHPRLPRLQVPGLTSGTVLVCSREIGEPLCAARAPGNEAVHANAPSETLDSTLMSICCS